MVGRVSAGYIPAGSRESSSGEAQYWFDATLPGNIELTLRYRFQETWR